MGFMASFKEMKTATVLPRLTYWGKTRNFFWRALPKNERRLAKAFNELEDMSKAYRLDHARIVLLSLRLAKNHPEEVAKAVWLFMTSNNTRDEAGMGTANAMVRMLLEAGHRNALDNRRRFFRNPALFDRIISEQEQGIAEKAKAKLKAEAHNGGEPIRAKLIECVNGKKEHLFNFSITPKQSLVEVLAHKDKRFSSLSGGFFSLYADAPFKEDNGAKTFEFLPGFPWSRLKVYYAGVPKKGWVKVNPKSDRFEFADLARIFPDESWMVRGAGA